MVDDGLFLVQFLSLSTTARLYGPTLAISGDSTGAYASGQVLGCIAPIFPEGSRYSPGGGARIADYPRLFWILFFRQ